MTDLPQPDSPTSASVSRGASANDTSSTAACHAPAMRNSVRRWSTARTLLCMGRKLMSCANSNSGGINNESACCMHTAGFQKHCAFGTDAESGEVLQKARAISAGSLARFAQGGPPFLAPKIMTDARRPA